MTRTPTRTVAALALLAGLLLVGGAGTATADDGAQLTVTNATVDENETSTLRLALSRAPAGLSGYEVTLVLSESGVAEITNASYPDTFQLTTEPAITGDGQRVTLEAAVTDTPPGATNVTLATVEVTGTGGGTTAVRVTDAQVDADNGSRVAPAYSAGSVAVEPLSNDGGGTQNGDETGDDSPEGSSPAAPADDPGSDESSTPTGAAGPGFGVIVALAALLAVALLARRRR
ncbi:PGF-CTERM sorting domain-containing protein [Halorientalis pallida]|uniref:PGF-CTERM sorting domain-containing protein n=1 Tax=Halorientalis pallida TaxID=2479928 RepID=A0A498KZX5_9EURY|nr:PGF-CTERM sorting domain-containing protein [Halorientalis pallida]RXK50133.1 PGF-CTERM sorting domain-containing protein [Halorientalis pallida]